MEVTRNTYDGQEVRLKAKTLDDGTVVTYEYIPLRKVTCCGYSKPQECKIGTERYWVDGQVVREINHDTIIPLHMLTIFTGVLTLVLLSSFFW